jgi:hypothetical protein
MSYRHILRTCALGFVGAITSGCVHTRVTPFDPNVPQPGRTRTSDVRFYGALRPRCPYDEIGRLSAESGLFSSWSGVIKAARNAVREMGGDAMINVRDSARISGATVNPSGVSLEEKTSLSGVVIRFRYVDCMD